MPIQVGYMSSANGILEIFQIIFSLSAFICAIIVNWTAGMAWCQFVGIFCAVCVTVHLILNVAAISLRIPAYIIIALVGYLIMSIFSLIAFIVACVIARKYYRFAAYYNLDQGALVAAAVFFLLATIVLIIDLVLQFKGYRVTMIAQSSSSTTVTRRTVVTTTAA